MTLVGDPQDYIMIFGGVTNETVTSSDGVKSLIKVNNCSPINLYRKLWEISGSFILDLPSGVSFFLTPKKTQAKENIQL